MYHAGRMKLLVVIVSYKTARLVLEGLASLAPEVRSRGDVRVTIVDNASGPEEAELLRSGIVPFADFCSLILSDENGGFSYGNNLAMRPALASDSPPAYFLLLNPDTVVRPDALSQLLDFMDSHPKAGIAGSRLEHPDGTPQRSAFRFPGWQSELEGGLKLGVLSRLLEQFVVAPPPRDTVHETDWVAGASMIIRREVLIDAGLFDEGYFLYFEEVDFCWRAKQAGWDTYYVPASRVVHYVGQATGVTAANRGRRRLPGYWFDSRRRFFLKSRGRATAVVADLARLCGQLGWEVRTVVEGKKDRAPYAYISELILRTAAVHGVERAQLPSWAEEWLHLVELLEEDFDSHRRDFTRPGFRALAVHRFGNWRMTVEPKLLRAPLSIGYRAAYRFVRDYYGIELPYSAKVGRRVVLEHQHGIVVHGNSVIGDDCVLRQGVTLGVRSVDHPDDAPKLGNGVQVGAGAVILGNVTVGDGAAIGANAVVLKDVPAGALAVGVPAKVSERKT